MKVSIIIPTIKPITEIVNMIEEIKCTVHYDLDLIVESSEESAAINTNRGMDRAEGEYIIICGDDVEGFPQGWDRALVDAIEVTGASMVGPRLLNPDGTLQAVNYANYDLSEDYVQTCTMITAICIIHNTALRMDENYKGSGYDDTDFCNQLGGPFYVANTVKLVHRNEKKNQFNEYNRAYFNKKWNENDNASAV